MPVTKQLERKSVTKTGSVRIAQPSASLEMTNMVIMSVMVQVE